MTISYQRDVASSTAGGFTRLLFKWKGSLYKLICRELLLFLIVYTLLGVIYRQLMSPAQKELFESVVKYFDAFLNLIPLSFVLGFYVSYVASRWWQQFLAIPWPDKLFHSIACYVEGFDEESRMLRRSLMRYMNLALILVLRSISSAVKQRFPTLDHVVEAGFMTPTEKELFSAVPANEFNTYWVPCTWFVYRLQEATKRGKLLNQYSLENIMREFCEFRAKCGLLWCYDWVSIPMVYTQVVTLATYVFFIFTIIGRQKIDGFNVHKAMRSGRIPLDIDLYIPIFTILQFFFYMGLLKVAEQLINPFGDDDEDFELNWLIDRHVKASFLGCDILMNPERIPPMVKDYYWDKQDCPIPYTEASMHFKKKTYRGSADEIKALAAAITQAQMQRVHGTRGEIPYGAPGDRGGGDYRREEAVSHQPAPRDLLAMGAQRSMESEEGDITEGEERRGSIPTLSTSRRGSRLQDILRFNQEKKRKRDSQGFTWKRMPTQSFDDIQSYEEPSEEPTPPNVTNAEVSPEQLAAIAAALAATSNVSTEQFIENSINELPYGKRGYQSYIHALPYSTTVIKPEQLAALSHEERSDIHPEHMAALLRGRADNQAENLANTPRKRSDLQPDHPKAMPHDKASIELDNLAGLSRGRSDIQPISQTALSRCRSDIQSSNQAALSRERSDIQPENQTAMSLGRPGIMPESQAAMSRGRSDIQPENKTALTRERSDIQPENQAALSRGRPEIQPENKTVLTHGRSNIQPENQAALSRGRADIQPENQAALSRGRSDIKPDNQQDMSRVRSDLQPEPLAVPTFEETGVQLKYLSTLAPGDREGTSHYTQDIRGTRIKTVPLVSPVPPETKTSQSKKDSLTMSPSGRVSSPSGRGSNPPQSYIQIEGNGRHNYGLPVGRPIDASPKKSSRKSRLSKTGNGGGGASGYKDGNGASRQRKPRDPDSGSLQSEHSFRTCSEEPEPPLVPRAVSDNYEYTSRASLERPGPTSVKTVQQQRYSNALDAVVGTSAGTPGTNRSGAQTSLSGGAASSGGGSPLPYTPSNRTTPASSRAKR